MTIARTRRIGAASAFALALAGLLSGPVQADVAAQTVAVPPAPAPIEQVAPEMPQVVVEPAVEEAEPEEQFSLLGEGMASYYGAELAGNRTASGERFDPNGLTAAHRTLPMGTRVRVTNKANGKSVVVRINDRGPFVKKRIIDVSRGAAERISMIRSGTARVTLERVA